MKRLLVWFLVLALACTVLAPAALGANVTATGFTDWDQVENQSQVAMLVDLNLISGYSDGSFRPYNCMTRAETAKIVSGLLTEQVPQTTESRFADVAGTWSAPYVQFCVDKGILSGYEDGFFRPNDYLTIRQLAKMLLAALGHKSTAYTGSGWAAAVDADADALGIYAGLDENYDRYVTRDEACLMIGNALQCPIILGYDSDGEPEYVLDDLMSPRSMLEYRFYIIPVTGVVTANAVANLQAPGGKLDGNLIHIDGYARNFAVSPSVARDTSLLGHEVTVYVRYGMPYHQVYGLPGIRAQEQCAVFYSAGDLDALVKYGALKIDRETMFSKDLQPDDASCLDTMAAGDTLTVIDHEGDGVVDVVLLTTQAAAEAAETAQASASAE